MDFEAIVSKLAESTRLPRDEILRKIRAKQEELSGLVSAAGAAHIIANELGVQTLPPLRALVRAEDLKDGTNSVEISLRVVRVFPVREFERQGTKGKVLNVIAGDETGNVRLVLWGRNAELADKIAEGQVIRVVSGYVKLDRAGKAELHAGNRTRLILNPDDERSRAIPEIAAIMAERPKVTYIADLKGAGEGARIRAAVLKVFQRQPFFEVCPSCGRSLSNGECREHKAVQPAKALIVSAMLDDGTGSIRATFFKKAAEQLLGMSTADAEKIAGLAGNPLVVLTATDRIIGREKVFSGRARRNEMFGRLEMIADSVEEMDVSGEINALLKD